MPGTRTASNVDDALAEVPPEVLEHIFFWTVQAEISGSVRRHPRAFAQVSRFWRSTALAYPRLWNQIPPIITDWDDKPQASSNKAQYLTLFIQRSKELPLSFSLTARSFTGVGTKQYTSTFTIVSMLLEHSNRWGNISLNLSSQFYSMFSRAKGKVPMLNTLNISTRGEDSFNITYFKDAPALRHVSSHSRGSISWTLTLPWSQLETYTEDSSSENGFSSVLSRSSTHLTSATLTTSKFNPRRSVGELVSHPRLTYLSLDNSDPHSRPGFFAKDLILPSLKDLHIIYRTSLVAPSVKDVSSLIFQSDCSLLRLTLLGLTTDPGALSSMLLHCGDLEELTIDIIPEIDLQRLIFKEGSNEVLVPKLLNFHIRYPVYFIMENTPNKLDGRSLDQVARSRVDRLLRPQGSEPRAVRTLRSITIQFTTPNVAQTVFEQLEGWSSCQVSDAESVKTIKNWEAVIAARIRKRRKASVAKRLSLWGGSILRPGTNDDLKNVLKEMEEFISIEGVDLRLAHVSKFQPFSLS